MSLNKAMIIGNLGADPETRDVNGSMVATLSVATSEKWTGKDGQRQEKTEWHRVVVWDKLAELCDQYLRKGAKVYIEGKIQTRSFDDANGQKKYSTEIVAQRVEFLDGADGRNDADGRNNAAQAPAPAQGGYGQRAQAPATGQRSQPPAQSGYGGQQRTQAPAQGGQRPHRPNSDDDIPF